MAYHQGGNKAVLEGTGHRVHPGAAAVAVDASDLATLAAGAVQDVESLDLS